MSLVLTIGIHFLLLIFCHHAIAAVVLDSSVGMRQACPGETVTYTCTVIQGIALDWIVEPFISGTGIRFQNNTPTDRRSVGCSNVSPPQCDNINFMATLTNTANSMTVVNAAVADITSTLTIIATARLNGTVVQCRGITAVTQIANRTVNVAGLPSPPRFPTSTVQQYGRDSVTLTVQWQSPQYDGGAPVNYTITVSPDVGTFTTSGTNVMVPGVSYNMNHTVRIVATNCNGSSSAAMETIPAIVNCSNPTVPGNGSIEAYQNTTEGAEIVFRCDQQYSMGNPGFVPAGNMTAVCGADGRWSPDPGDLVCTFTCGPPVAPQHGSLESHTDTTEGSEVFYSCNQGLVPEGRMRSVCTRNGWSPNPAVLNCTEVDCGAPPPPVNGFLQLCMNTTEGSVVVFWCNPGFVPGGVMTAVCGRDGQWTPSPGGVTCSPRPTQIPIPTQTSTPTGPVDCGMPFAPENGFIENIQDINTTGGAQIAFRCNESFVPVGRMSATCTPSNGSWTPNPAVLICNASNIVCEDPALASGVTVVQPHRNAVNSEIVYRCQESGFTPSVPSSMCDENGMWSPDSSRVMCRMMNTPGSLSGGAVAAIVIVLLLVVVVLAVAVVIVILWLRKRSDGSPKPPALSDDVAMYSVVEDPEKPAPYKGYVDQGPGTEAEYTVVSDIQAPSKPAEPHYDLPPGSNHPEGLVYASVEIKPKKPSAPPKPVKEDDRVEYAAIAYQPKDAAKNSQAAAATAPKTKRYPDADELVNLDNLLIQLRNVTPMWFDLGDALDLPPSILDDIRGQFETNPQQCMIEVVDAWLQRHLSRGSPTWTEVAEALRKINQNGLADALENVYYTGDLPISVNMNEVPESVFPADSDGSPPPIPIRGTLTDDVEPAPPKPPKSWGTPEKKAPPQRPPRGGSGRRPPPRPPKPSAP